MATFSCPLNLLPGSRCLFSSGVEQLKTGEKKTTTIFEPDYHSDLGRS
ncbi:hypothetical protein LEMLEM_LOCUS1365 [Lemmus lemmus]